MASTVQAPPPPPSAPAGMPPRRPRSLAGPVVLIVIGIFFLLRSLGWLPWYNWGHLFAQFWPLLLILWGVIKLIEYQQANRAGVRPRGIGAGGFFLIFFLVIAGLSAHEMTKWNWHGLDEMCEGSDADSLPWCGHTYSFTDELNQPFPPGATLHVNSQRGAVNVTSSDDNQIHVTVHKRVRGDKQEQAESWNKSTRPQISVNGQILTLEANTHGSGDHWVSSDLDVAIPRKAGLLVDAHHGDVSVLGREGNAEIRSEGGDVSVTDLNGSLVLNLDHSSARISQVSSDVTIQGRANDVSLEDIKGAVRLDGDFMESVKLSRVAKPVSFKTSRTDMDFTKLDGYLNLDSGDLEATSVSGPLRLRTRSKDIMLNGVTSDVRLQNENGAIEIHLSKIGNTEITNRKGDIRVFVPQKAGFQLDAQVRDGEIQSEFSSLKIENGEDHSSANGSVNGGGPHVVINNEHGTIEIRSGSIIPTPPAPPAVPAVPKISHGEGTPEPPDASEN